MTQPCAHCARPYLRKLSTAKDPKRFCTQGCQDCDALPTEDALHHTAACGLTTGKYDERFRDA